MMRKFTVALYFLITTIILGLLNLYLASTEMYAGKIAQIDANFAELLGYEQKSVADNENLLVVGNSYVAASFDPDIAGENKVLFTVAGMAMVDAVGIVEHLPEDTVIDVVLVGLGYNYASPVGGVSSGYAPFFAGDPVRRAWASLPLVRGRSLASVALKEDVKCLLARFVEVRCSKTQKGELEIVQDNGDEEGLVDPIQKEQVMRKSVQRRYNEYVPFTSHLGDDFKNNLLRMREACRRRDIKLYAYTAPIYSELREMLTEATLEEFRATVSSTGIEYVDLNAVFPNWDAKMFSDATHVEKGIGSKRITKYLLNYIESEQ